MAHSGIINNLLKKKKKQNGQQNQINNIRRRRLIFKLYDKDKSYRDIGCIVGKRCYITGYIIKKQKTDILLHNKNCSDTPTAHTVCNECHIM